MDRVLKIINILLLSIVGMLLLIGVMVLVQGSKVDIKAADWWAALSAVATVGTFAVAFAAYKKAPDWLHPKLKDRKFKFADELLDDFYELRHEALEVFSYLSAYMHTTTKSNSNASTTLKDINLKIEKYIKNAVKLGHKVNQMIHWELSPKNKKEIDSIVKAHNSLYALMITIQSYKNANPDDTNSEKLKELDVEFSKLFNALAASYKALQKPYSELFEK